MNMLWFKQLGIGMAGGFALMAIPALFLFVIGVMHWHVAHTNFAAQLAGPVSSGICTMAAVAVAEELLFRGFIFQRLCDAIGAWPAQIGMACLFLLTHLNNPSMTGMVKVWASANIFLASLLFGIAFLRTGALAMPIGLHFMANVTQGPLLGLGVSGNAETGLLAPLVSPAPQWLSGGPFGLEASLPGLICVIAAVMLIATLRSRSFPGLSSKTMMPPACLP